MNRAAFAEARSGTGPSLSAVVQSLESASGAAFVTPHRTTDWTQWLNLVRQLTRLYSAERGRRVGLRMKPSERAYAWLVALGLLECDVFLVDGQTTSTELDLLTRAHRLDQMIDGDDAIGEFTSQEAQADTPGAEPREAKVTIFTSGSSGSPKPVCHGWHSLLRAVRPRRASHPLCWLLTYRPQLYAGLQVFLHCLLNRETLVIPEQGMPVDELLALARTGGASAISATPSYWRRLLSLGNREAIKQVPLEQITLGGEAADQALLDTLKSAFPGARLVHIYATSELGRCFSVQDGIAGFPARYLDGPSEEGVLLKLEGGEVGSPGTELEFAL